MSDGSLTSGRNRAALGRRDLLAGVVAVTVLGLARPALARPSLEAAVQAFTGGAEIQSGGIKLEIPPLVENGNAVGVTVTVDSAMTDSDHVRRIALINEKNPQADVAVFHLTRHAGQAKVSTRIRLATSQIVVAIAELSDGSFRSAQAEVYVTLAACTEDLI